LKFFQDGSGHHLGFVRTGNSDPAQSAALQSCAISLTTTQRCTTNSAALSIDSAACKFFDRAQHIREHNQVGS